MKKYILLMIGLISLMFANNIYANDYTQINFKEPKNIPLLAVQMIHFAGVSTGIPTDSCTGSLVLAWHMEDLNLANESGCSALGDSLWAAGNASLVSTDKSDGTYAGYATTGVDRQELDPTSFPSTEGTVWFDVRFGTNWTADQILLGLSYSGGNNWMYVYKAGSAGNIDITVGGYWQSNWHSITANTDIDYSDNKWWRIKLQWKDAASNADLQIDVWELDDSTPRETTGSPITAGPSQQLEGFGFDIDFIRIGNVDSNTDTTWWDRLYIYNTSDL